MSLTPLVHYKLPVITVTTSTCAGLLDHIYTALSQTTDFYGNAVPSPLSVSKYQNAGTTEAVYGTFGAASATNPKFLIAGVNAARTPLMSASTNGAHTWTANTLNAGLTREAGAFASWDHATQPFTSGKPIGLCKFYDASVVAAKVHAYISNETLWVFIETVAGAFYCCGIGAIIDPETTSINSCETDGRLYSVVVQGTTGAIGGTFNTIATGMFGHSTTNGQEQFLTLTPRGTTSLRTNKLFLLASSNTTTLTNRDNEPYRLLQVVRDTVADKILGRLREISFVRDSKFALTQAPSLVPSWFYIGSSATVDADCFGLHA